MESAVIGRVAEKIQLKKLLASNRPEFLAVYGRRRVGKTFLISEFFEDKGRFLEIVGSIDATLQVQLARFAVEMTGTFPHLPKDLSFENWEQAFISLVNAIDRTMKKNPEEKIILFFDETPWLDEGNSGFLSALGYAWNRHFSKSKYQSLVVVVCGSAASWMIGHVIESKGGLHNRVTATIRLSPFTLGETMIFFESRGIVLPAMQIIEIYMALGGVAAYLAHVESGKSSSQIINHLCFSNGPLNKEFEQLFRSLFAKHHNHLKIVHALASAPRGLTRKDLINRTGLGSGGETSLFLRELKESGFITAIPIYGKKERGRFYRLIDEYSLFYLKWIEPVNTRLNISSNYWQSCMGKPSWLAWAGYAFEGICLKHVDGIKQALGISGIITIESSWRHITVKDSSERGAQVDLVIDRADHTINLCELKFVGDEFEITHDYKRVLDHKKKLFKKYTRTKSLLLTTLLTPHGVKKGKNYFGTVDCELTIDCLFLT